MEGIYNKENLFAEFAMQKTNEDKVKFLKEMKQLKKDQPHMFRGTSITQKNFDNLIAEWSKEKRQLLWQKNKTQNRVSHPMALHWKLPAA